MQRLGIWLFWLLITVIPGGLASLVNQSLSLVLPNTNNDYEFICDGSRYGTFLDEEVSACVDATKAIAPGRERVMFAMRDTPEATKEAYPLPWRWMNGYLLTPGLSNNHTDNAIRPSIMLRAGPLKAWCPKRK